MQTDINIHQAPFVRSGDSIWEVMSDVLLSLIPCAAISYLAYGSISFWVILAAIIGAIAAEFIFASIFLNKRDTLKDGSALVTAVLLALTLAPFTTWYAVMFGAAMSVIFGKILWGGLGRNRFNPALLGREFMTAFFPSIMASGSIWYNKDLLNVSSINIFNVFGENGFTQYLNTLLYKPSGAIGEYSILLLVIGGLYLLLRRRISWHIPFGLLTTFFILTLLFQGPDMKFSLGGLLLGTIFMATDMPSSASTKAGKLYYGAMIGLVTALCLLNGIKHEYMSYSILLLNGFATLINWVFKPRVWAAKSDWIKRVWQSTLLTIAITIAAYAVIYLHQHDAVRHVIFGYILFIISRFCFITMKREE